MSLEQQDKTQPWVVLSEEQGEEEEGSSSGGDSGNENQSRESAPRKLEAKL